jgi:hypothetical protein
MEKPVVIKAEPFSLKASQKDIQNFERETAEAFASKVKELYDLTEELKLLSRTLRNTPRLSSADRMSMYSWVDKYPEASKKYMANWQAEAKSETEKLARNDAMEQQLSDLLARKHALEFEINASKGSVKGKKTTIATEILKAANAATEGLKKGIEVTPSAEILPLIPMYKLKHKPIPDNVQLFKDHFEFYWIRFFIKLFYPQGWRIDELDPITIEFNPGEKIAQKRPVAWDVAPSTKFKEYMKFEGTAGIDVDLKITIPLNSISHLPIPKIGDVEAKAKANFLVLWEYSYKKASILSAGKLNSEPEWRIRGGDTFELLNSGDLELNVILKKLKALKSVNAVLSFKGFMSHRHFLHVRHETIPIDGTKKIDLLPLPTDNPANE